ncbi:hypothetical protein D915_010694 [Fasciola hepatica]|uniref:Uncharacterized protein n=1 Tax=Fasciola hepatica TaxID=6192 RepID=A0A4E0R9D0_FASHE|nr:hypothetical protein D915_010694 [Fasciola hepatica]
MAGCALHDPDAELLTFSKADLLEHLNPRIQHEVQQLHLISLCDQPNAYPLSIGEMKTFVLSLGTGEWNTNCHLKVIPKDQLIAQLPRAPRS